VLPDRSEVGEERIVVERLRLWSIVGVDMSYCLG
jgi:hypothetical protein